METIETLPASSLEAQMREILSPLRSAAQDAVEDLMQEAFAEVGKLLASTAKDSGKRISFDKQVCGLAPFLLKQIYEQTEAGKLEGWLAGNTDKDRYRRFSDFLDLFRMQQEGFRARFPKAYQKWTPEEDAELLSQYAIASEGKKKVHWNELGHKFGRNANAIKLRRGRLGVNLGIEAGVPRRA